MRLKLLTALLLALGLSVALAQPRTLIIAQNADVVTMDAHLATDAFSFNVIYHVVETLFKTTPEGRIEPHLVERFSFSPDRRVLTLNLRRGIRFHDGTEFNAAAVRFNLERLLSPELAAPMAFLLRGKVTAFEVVDAHTLRLRMPEPFSPILAHLAHGSTGIQSPEAIRRLGAAYRDNPVGTGPYRFDRWVRGQFVELVRNDDYWGRRLAIERLRFLAVPEAATRMALVETGQAHVALGVPPHDVPRLRARPEINVVSTTSMSTTYLWFNLFRRPFDDVRVRRAINHAINKEEIVNFVLGGFARVSDAPITPVIFGHSRVGIYAHNPALARRLLAEAGFDARNPLRFTLTSSTAIDPRITEAIQGQLRAVGVEARIEILEWGTFLATTRLPRERNEIQVGIVGWGAVTGDADYGLFPLFHSTQHAPVGFNRMFYSNPRADRILEQARVAMDPQARQRLYHSAMQIIFDDAPWVFLWSPDHLTAVRQEVQGLVRHPSGRILVAGASFRTP
jgi:peptide/nickel transport system substrate-binding protein